MTKKLYQKKNLTPKNIWNQKNLVKKYYDNEIIFGKKIWSKINFWLEQKKNWLKKLIKKNLLKNICFVKTIKIRSEPFG